MYHPYRQSGFVVELNWELKLAEQKARGWSSKGHNGSFLYQHLIRGIYVLLINVNTGYFCGGFAGYPPLSGSLKKEKHHKVPKYFIFFTESTPLTVKHLRWGIQQELASTLVSGGSVCQTVCMLHLQFNIQFIWKISYPTLMLIIFLHIWRLPDCLASCPSVCLTHLYLLMYPVKFGWNLIRKLFNTINIYLYS